MRTANRNLKFDITNYTDIVFDFDKTIADTSSQLYYAMWRSYKETGDESRLCDYEELIDVTAFPWATDMLKKISSKARIHILSNKKETRLIKEVKKLFPDINFTSIVGNAHKPAIGLLTRIAPFGLMVGDSFNNDMPTAMLDNWDFLYLEGSVWDSVDVIYNGDVL